MTKKDSKSSNRPKIFTGQGVDTNHSTKYGKLRITTKESSRRRSPSAKIIAGFGAVTMFTGSPAWDFLIAALESRKRLEKLQSSRNSHGQRRGHKPFLKYGKPRIALRESSRRHGPHSQPANIIAGFGAVNVTNNPAWPFPDRRA